MSGGTALKGQVREFYDSIGWAEVSEGLYQNARYEDLRPVSRAYRDRCHRRLGRFLPESGAYLLDAGSGPIQYPQYLEYSAGFRRRVCLDISYRALQEARKRIGDHGLFVVGDIAHLPFAPGQFDGVVSLHTVHHLPPEEHEPALRGLQRALAPGGRGAVVYSWGERSLLMRLLQPLIQLSFATIRLYRRLRFGPRGTSSEQDELAIPSNSGSADGRGPAPGPREVAQAEVPQGTYTFRHDHRWMRSRLGDLPGFEIRVWRSVSTNFLRAFIHRRLLGRLWLRAVFWLEERAPHLLGWLGQYPMLLFAAPGRPRGMEGSAG